MHEPLAEGVYELLLTHGLVDSLAEVGDWRAEISQLRGPRAPEMLSRHVGALLQRRLARLTDPEQQLDLVNQLVELLAENTASPGLEPLDQQDQLASPGPRQLLSLVAPRPPGASGPSTRRPSTPLSDPALLTNARGEPALAAELKAELATASRVDLLCAFVKWTGVRLLEAELSRLAAGGVPFRVVTTTYLGATDRRALDRLVRDYGAQVRVQYDALRTRLHAKAWMFGRDTGFHTGYVGSSNLSRAALLDGVEWNIRLSAVSTPSLLDKFSATFDTYWNDPSFEPYDPERDADRLDTALAEARGGGAADRVTLTLSGLEVRPYPYQQEMLDALRAERELHDHHRNLVVAATGTGKTVVAALDYRQLAGAGGRPTLLFVAHRKEILQQSLRTYREVLTDANFGELLVGDERPDQWRQVFASIQSLTAMPTEALGARQFDIVVIDEFHHAEAATYRRLLDHLQPRELLGLTATPERADGLDIRDFFEGRTAVELRLWDALGADLLSPFHYFAVSDGTDLSGVRWVRGHYDEAELSALFTGNSARARTVLRELTDKIVDLSMMRALGFCVSVEHAHYMAQVCCRAGIPALAVDARTPPAQRAEALAALASRQVNILFAVDLFNEGLDLPEVDTIVILRPTGSATVFLQQLGRGLRRTPDKAVCTVLDFVGQDRVEFRWDAKLRALTGRNRSQLVSDVERGFPFLPSGCQVVLDRVAQGHILANLRSRLGQRWPQLVAELRSQGDVDLPDFLEASGLDLSDLLRGSRSWTQLRRAAGLPTPAGGDRETPLLRRARAFSHVDDPQRAESYRRLLDPAGPGAAALSPTEGRLAEMLVYSCWPDGGGFDSLDAALTALRAEPAARAELTGVVDLAFTASRQPVIALGGALARVPLRVHASYQREEILAALGWTARGRTPSSFREGVVHLREPEIDAFFITLDKDESDYSPSTMYADYPISPTLFHWESQSTTSVASPTGQRYLSGASTVLLFVRQRARNEFGTAPYLFLGPAHHLSHSGDRPVAITWRLEHAMPMDFFAAASVAAG